MGVPDLLLILFSVGLREEKSRDTERLSERQQSD
jgi:hypothetical protein